TPRPACSRSCWRRPAPATWRPTTWGGGRSSRRPPPRRPARAPAADSRASARGPGRPPGNPTRPAGAVRSAFPRYFTVPRSASDTQPDEGLFQLRTADRLWRGHALRTGQWPPAAAADAYVRPHHPYRRRRRRPWARPDRGRTRRPPGPVVLPVPFQRRPGDARLPRPGRHVAADRLLPHLAEAARPRPRAWRGRGEVHR